MYVIHLVELFLLKIKFIFSFSLIANVTGRYWILEKVAFNGSEYRYFAYGMHNPMDTPPDYSYVCTTAVFIKYNSSSKYGIYDFKEKFYITNLQVNILRKSRRINILFK